MSLLYSHFNYNINKLYDVASLWSLTRTPMIQCYLHLLFGFVLYPIVADITYCTRFKVIYTCSAALKWPKRNELQFQDFKIRFQSQLDLPGCR